MRSHQKKDKRGGNLIWEKYFLHQTGISGHEKDFLYKPRGFNSTFENSETIVANYNEIVSDEDDVYCLGDCMLNDNDYGLEMIKSLKGRIHIIRGNHDSNTRIELYKTLPNVVEVCEAKTIKIGKQSYFLSHYPSLTANYDDKPYHNHLINLYGHTHQKTNFYENNPFMYHVGVDSHNCYPVSIEEINQDIHDKVEELYQDSILGEKIIEKISKDLSKNIMRPAYIEISPKIYECLKIFVKRMTPYATVSNIDLLFGVKVFINPYFPEDKYEVKY